MTDSHTNRIKAAYEQYLLIVAGVRDEIHQSRRFNVGDRVTRGNITGVIVGLGTFSISEKPPFEKFDTQYWLRVEAPDDFNTHQECEEYGLEAGKAQDFWDLNLKWQKVN